MQERFVPIILFVTLANFIGLSSFGSFATQLYDEFPISKLTDLEDQWQKRIWISKTARMLWKGYEIRDSRLFDRWIQMDEESIVSEMLADDRFVRTAIDFAYYYLGRKMSDAHFVWGDDLSMQQLEQYPQVIQLAKQLTEGKGNFFDFYSNQVPYYIPRLFDPVWFEFDEDEGSKKKPRPETPAEIREALFQLWYRSYQKMHTYLEGVENPNPKHFCSEVYSVNPFIGWLNFYGYPFMTLVSHPNYRADIFQLFSICNGPEYTDQFVETALKSLASVHEFVSNIHTETKENYEVDVYRPTGFAELKLGPMSVYPEQVVQPFQMSYNDYINNNSTNYNRKRAAYMLDRFFCDDLTPVAIEDNGDHTDTRHGTQAACMACHYRLDPMAGFFRYNGSFFFDYKDSDYIVFDDQATMAIEEYVGEWRNPAGSAREWNIGYIRSEARQELNHYGESLEDLSKILKTAPEVRLCLVKRVFQYMTSSDQTFDGDFIDYVTESFNDTSEESSLQAFKGLFGTAALSFTYSKDNRSPNECYDYRPGVDPSNRPPCAVASILDNACVECHKSPGGKGNLNLDTWVEITPGVFSFEHYNDDYITQLPKGETMARIAERISSPNSKLRMPKGGGYMTAVDRKDLYLWALEQSESSIPRSEPEYKDPNWRRHE